MDTSNGKIYNLTKEEAEACQKETEQYQKRLSSLCKEANVNSVMPIPRLVSITEEQEQFFRNKGLAFRALWAKKIANGLSPEDSIKLNFLIAQTKYDKPE